MKNLLTFHLLLAGILFVSCHKSNLHYENDLNKSYAKWQTFQKTSNDSYQYTVIGGTWVGYGWQTTITVTNGIVTQRYYKLTPAPGVNSSAIPADQLEWTEGINRIGVHTQTPAAEPITLEAVYEKARTEWLIKRPNAQAYFEARNDGLLSEAGYIENGCQDDCFRGIQISAIQKL